MKLCKDCRWANNPHPEPPEPRFYDWICTHPASLLAPLPNYVTGETPPAKQMPCAWARNDVSEERCGPEAKYWEDKN